MDSPLVSQSGRNWNAGPGGRPGYRAARLAGWASLILSAVGVFGPRHAEAANKTWDGGGVGSVWGTAANWDLDTVPANGDNAFFNSTFTSGTAITLGANKTASSAESVGEIGLR